MARPSFSLDRQRRLNIEPKAGGMLMFQHDRLIQEGATVVQGVKLAVRIDLPYEWVSKKVKSGEPGWSVRN